MRVRHAGISFALAIWASSLVLGGEVGRPELKTVGDLTYVVWRGQPVLELFEGRALRFRATPDNDHWVGVRSTPDITVTPDITTDDARIGLTWGSRNDPDYTLEKLDFEASPEGFTLVITANKTQPAARIVSEVKAALLSAEEGFEYELRSQLKTRLSQWREAHRYGTKGERTIEPFNYHLERISMPTRLRSIQEGQSDLYDGFVRSEDGRNWLFIPKLHVPPHIIKDGWFAPSNYSGNNYRGELPLSDVGSFFGVLDSREGGWMTEVLETTKPLKISLCWMFFDVHCYMYAGIPEKSDEDRFEPRCALRFIPVKPQRARELLATAREVPWKGTPEYDLPVLSHYNTFSELVSPGRQCWFKSDFRCFRDETVGCDDHYSISIKKEADDEAPSAWYGWCWGPGYDRDTPLKGVYRFSAKIKTLDCQGTVRFGVNEFSGDNWYGRNKPGEWHNKKHFITYAEKELTGTNDWTHVSLDLVIDDAKISELMDRPISHMWIRRAVFFEQVGKGQCWIDNVSIQPLEPME